MVSLNTNFTQRLHEAAAHDELDTVKQLINEGVSCYATDENNRSAFNYAASNGLRVLAWLTETAFNDTQKPKDERRWKDYDLNTPSGYYGSTLITYAAKVCSVSLISRMIEAGADLTVVNGSGWTLLHCAAVMPERISVLKLLVQTLQNQDHGEIINSLTTHVYETDYQGHKVVYGKGLTAQQLCRARLEQDPECPSDLIQYLQYFTAAFMASGW